MPYQPGLIEHDVDGEIICQRPVDGYINATAMCKKAGKQFGDYSRLKTTANFLDALSFKTGIPVHSTATGIPVAALIHVVVGVMACLERRRLACILCRANGAN